MQHVNFLTEYQPYLVNYNQALATIQYLEKKYPEVKRIVAEFEQQQAALNGQNLHSFLVIPVQRIPRYILLLKVWVS